jgi:hypothetical protein
MESVVFTLNAGPPLAGPKANPHFLKIGGELNSGLGSNFLTFDNLFTLPARPDDPPRNFDLTFKSSNLQITLTFCLLSSIF